MHSHQTTGDLIAEQIRRHRERLGMNRHDLAAECARLGRPDLTFAVLTTIETGRTGKDGKKVRRPVAVDELLVLGLALAVPPLLLMLPLGSEQAVPTVPNRDPRDPYTVWRWWTGEETPTLGGPIDGRYIAESQPIGENGPKWAAAWASAAYPASMYPEFERRRDAVHRAYLRAETAHDKRKTDKEGHVSAQTDYLHRLEELARHINDMTLAGLQIPQLRPDLIEDMKGLDMLDDPDHIQTRGDE
ncbi:hypothetical protein [Streptomyces sp. NPDC097981]|uniref:hypothetical protein n=1 Tax=Streptomyces sp. NPDC097981 TaxID=3155428 RepID=UPI00331E9DF2